MNIAVYYGSQFEYDYFINVTKPLLENNFISIKMYSCFLDILYDIEEKKYYDIIIFGANYHEQTILAGKKARQLIRDIILVYVSTGTEFAPKAVEIGAFRYIDMHHKDDVVNGLFSAIAEVMKKQGRHYTIITNRHYIKIPCDDIMYCYKSGKMSIIVTEYSEFKERISLYELYKRLKNLSNKFIMIERGHITSISKICRIEKNIVFLKGDICLPVGRTYTAILKELKENFNCFANNH